jgi:undecaprenyl pyrophosphate phosphatase UppP
MRWPFLAGVVASALTGWVVIAFFLRFVRTRTLLFFVYYRLVFGIIVIARAVFLRR